MTATIHFTHGFIGFGKTTVAKKLAAELPAVRLNNDEFMVRLYGRNPPEEIFQDYYARIEELIWELTEQIVNVNIDVIIDAGVWSREARKKAFDRARQMTDKVIFHNVMCDMETAKQRAIARTSIGEHELVTDENVFEMLLPKFEPISPDEGYTIINHKSGK